MKVVLTFLRFLIANPPSVLLIVIMFQTTSGRLPQLLSLCQKEKFLADLAIIQEWNQEYVVQLRCTQGLTLEHYL